MRRRRPRDRRADRRVRERARASRSTRPARTTGRSPARAPRPAAPLIAGDPHLPPVDARDHLPARPLRSATVRPRRGVSRPARDHLRPEQRRRLDVDERDGRHDGPLRRAASTARPTSSRARRGRWPCLEEEIEVKGRRARAASSSARPTTDRSSTRRSAPTSPSRWRWLGRARRARRHSRRASASSTYERARAGRALAELAMPVSSLVWADRHGSIGYKTIGRLPMRRGDCPDLPSPVDRRVRVGGLGPLRRACPS